MAQTANHEACSRQTFRGQRQQHSSNKEDVTYLKGPMYGLSEKTTDTEFEKSESQLGQLNLYILTSVIFLLFTK